VWEEHAQLINFLELQDKEAAIALIKKHLVSAAMHVEFALKATTDSDQPD
jgi:DNA-binding GntR family transcriptional regulator